MPEIQSGSVLEQSGLRERQRSWPTLQAEEVCGLGYCKLRHFDPQVACTDGGWGQVVGEISAVAQGVLCLCLRPGEWLLQCAAAAVPSATAALVLPADGLMLDCSDALTTLRISGLASPWLLSKLAALDFHQMSRSGVPHCAQSRAGQIRVIILHHAGAHGAKYTFDLLVEREYARYLWELICNAAPHAVELAGTYGS